MKVEAGRRGGKKSSNGRLSEINGSGREIQDGEKIMLYEDVGTGERTRCVVVVVRG